MDLESRRAGMCPVTSLIQFSRRGVDQRKQLGLRALPQHHLLLPHLETNHLPKMDCWSDPGGHCILSCATANKSHNAVTLCAEVFPIRHPFLISSRLPHTIRSGLTTFLNICYCCPHKKEVVWFFYFFKFTFSIKCC